MPHERDRVRSAALLQEAIAGLVQRPGWSVLTALGTVVGVAVLVVVLGSTTSASVQVTTQFNFVEATEVRVTCIERLRPRVAPPGFPIDAAERAARINGVRGAGLQRELKQRAAKPPETRDARAIVVSAGTFEVAGTTFSQGRGFNTGHEQRGARVMVIDNSAVRDLRIDDLSRDPAAVIGRVLFTVIGIIDDTKRLPELLTGVVTPTRTTQVPWHDPPPKTKVDPVVGIAPGAAQVVGPQLLTATSAIHPEHLSVSLSPSPEGLHVAVNSQLSGLSLGFGVVCPIVGMIGIASTAIVAVIEYTGETGLRRVMGAQPHHVAAQSLLEAAALGGLDRLVRTDLGVVVVAGIYATLTWAAVVPLLLVAVGPPVNLMVGMLVDIYLSLQASRLESAGVLHC